MGAVDDRSLEGDKKRNTVDAGSLPPDHYKSRLPRWRYAARQKLLPWIRWETPRLAYMQHHVRTPFLDSYFAFSANLGTHTFFMIMLPILFWFGYADLGRGVVHVLASGVFLSGFMKDLFCLPRPLSPPLHRITMSGSAALEYGFPSTHSINAVGAALYGLLVLENSDVSLRLRIALQVLAAVYTFSITFGRLYCGMHGFLDVLVGSVLGVWLAVIQFWYQHQLDAFVFSDSVWSPIAVVAAILVLVRIHPEPADACPCFDDGVAFAAVVMGVEIGNWHYAKSAWSWNEPALATTPFSYQELGLLKSTLRVVSGVFVIFMWREIAKPTFHHFLPPVYRFVDRLGLILPRKDFTPASEYKKVPRLPDDTLPSFNEIPALIENVRRGRGRSDSVGPQSAADAYETLAYRESRRRESTSQRGPHSPPKDVEKYMKEMGSGEVDVQALAAGNHGGDHAHEEAEMFSKIERPRVRYDVEVVTKLVVYAGIGWWAVEGCPILFEILGMGMGDSGFEA